MSIFIGREKELFLLNQLVTKSSASLVAVKGRRRIGKSRLIQEFARPYTFISLSGLPPTPGINAQDQRDEVSRQMSRALGGPVLKFDDWGDLFWVLAQATTRGRVVILLDEISWMAHGDETFLGKLKNIWDQLFKQNDKLIMVLCSSISAWLDKNILSHTGFMGRISLTLTLQELSLSECNEFWGKYKDSVSSYEKLKVLSVTGGVPNYLENIQPQLSAEQNIKLQCFIKEGMLFTEFDKIFNDLFGKRDENYKRILQSMIAKPHCEMKEIFEYLNIQRSGVYVNYLDDLIQAGFLEKNHAWNIKARTQSKISQYRIKDNYVRFYLKYIEPNKSKIENNAYTEHSISTLPGWSSIMGLQMENLVLNNRVEIQRQLQALPGEIIWDGPYFQRANSKTQGCQIDYLIQTKYNCLYVCEIKFSRDPVTSEVIKEVENKIKALSAGKNFSYRPVLIHVNGVNESVIESEFFAHIIDLRSLLE